MKQIKHKETVVEIAFTSVFLLSISSATLAEYSQCVDGQLTLTETQITTNESVKVNPSIYGDR